MEQVRAVCEWSTLTTSKSGTPSIKCKFKLLDRGEYIYHDFWLSEKAIDRSRQTLRGIFGWFGDDVSEFYECHELLNDVEVELVIEDETYLGKTEKKVKYVNPIGGHADAVTRISREEAKNIGAELRGKLMLLDQNCTVAAPAKPVAQSKPAAAPKPAVAAAASQSADNDDGLPF